MYLQISDREKANQVLKGWRLVNDVDGKELTREELKDLLRQAREVLDMRVNLTQTTDSLRSEWGLIKNAIDFRGGAINWHRVGYCEAQDRYVHRAKRPQPIRERDYLPVLNQLEGVGKHFYLRQLEGYINENHLGYGSLIRIMELRTLRWHLRWFMKKGSRPILLNQSRAALRRELIILVGEISNLFSHTSGIPSEPQGNHGLHQ